MLSEAEKHKALKSYDAHRARHPIHDIYWDDWLAAWEAALQAPQGPRDMLQTMVLELNRNGGRISEETLTKAEICLFEIRAEKENGNERV